MNPQDVKRLLSIIDHTRDRALFILLLRTGIRIGEALGLTMNNVDLKDRKVHLFQGEKNDMGRVVYMRNDAVFCLKRWFRWRDPEKRFIFYGKGDASVSYSTARAHFAKYLEEAGLTGKGYTVHALRHTFASELLNAGMRLEVLQQLMGHQDIEMTRRYARLTDRTKEEEYFRAMHSHSHYLSKHYDYSPRRSCWPDCQNQWRRHNPSYGFCSRPDAHAAYLFCCFHCSVRASGSKPHTSCSRLLRRRGSPGTNDIIWSQS